MRASLTALMAPAPSVAADGKPATVDTGNLRLLPAVLIAERDTACPLSTVLTAVLREVVEDMAPLSELLI